MTADKKIYKCPKCGYVTHFEKALKAHMNFRKHFASGGKVKTEKPVKLAEIQPPEQVMPQKVEVTEEVKEKKVRKPRTRKTAAKEKE